MRMSDWSSDVCSADLNDVVEICGLFGTVEKITIRSVVIRTLDGGYHLIPFSTVDKVTNHMRDFGYHSGVYNVGYRENADNDIAHLGHELGRASGRERECEYVWLSVVAVS